MIAPTDAHPIDDPRAVRHDRSVYAARLHRPPPRHTGLRRWGARVLGLLATSVLLGVGVASALMVLPAGDDGELAALDGVVPDTPASAKGDERKRKSDEPKLTARERRQRKAAVATLREQGYRPLGLASYEPDSALRVLVGRGDGGQRAFFFARGSYIGTDAADDSHRVRVVRAGERSVTLAYRLFSDGDRACCPSGGTARVRFRLAGETLEPQTPIPAPALRRPPA